MAYKSGNPGLNAKTFDGLPRPAEESERMTLQGTVNKSYLLLAVLVSVSSLVWSGSRGEPNPMWAFVGAIAGLGLALAIIFKKELAPSLAVPYAVAEGVVLGVLSSLFELRYPGIVLQSVTLTFGVFLAMLMGYTSGRIKPSQNMKLGIFAATGGIGIVYLVSLVGGMFGHPLSIVNGDSTFAIAFSVFVVAVAAFNLVIDFDFIEQGAQQGAPRYMEWYGAFGLMVTMIWLYMEILRLLSKRRR